MASFTDLAGTDFIVNLASKEACLADDQLRRRLELIGDKLIQNADAGGSDVALGRKYAAAIAYYLAGHYARAYVILSNTEQCPLPDDAFKLLRLFFTKEFCQLEQDAQAALACPENQDKSLAIALNSGTTIIREALARVVVAELGRSLSSAWRYAREGNLGLLDAAIGRLDILRRVAQDPRTDLDEGYSWVLSGASVLLKEFRENALRTQLDIAGMLVEPSPSGDIAQAYTRSAAQRSPPLIELWRSQTVALPKINEVTEIGRPSFLLKAPTSAGKTNIAELAILRFLMDTTAAGEEEKKCLYIAPFRALASEVERKLRKHLKPLNVWVTEFYGGFEISPADRMQLQIGRVLVATPEKVEAMLRSVPEFANQIGLIIVDEGHIIDGGERGMRFEMLMQRLVRRFGERGTRLVFMSAVMGNADQLSQWITGQDASQSLITSDYRPTTNYLGILNWDGTKAQQMLTYCLDGKHSTYQPYSSQAMTVVEAMPHIGRRRFPRSGKDNEVVALAALRLARDGVTLVFSPLPNSCESIVEGALRALEYASDCRKLGKEVDALTLKTPVLGSPAYERWKRCKRLAEGIAGKDAVVTRALDAGIVMHHRELPEKLRDEFAVLLQEGDLPLIVATSTVVHGVNSPVRTILARSIVRGDETNPSKVIPATEFFNLAGRAGRAMKERDGALLLFTTPDKGSRAKEQIKQYVMQQNSLALQSQLQHFLQAVAGRWQTVHRESSLEELCIQLAEGHVDWLTAKEQFQLAQLDASLVAALEEQEIDTDPDAVQRILERSLLTLQCSPDSIEYQTSMSILVARVEHLAKLPSDDRRRFYHSGLSLSDYRQLDEHRDDVIHRLMQLAYFDHWTDTDRVDFVCALYEDLLGKLSILKHMDDHKLLSWPAYIGTVLREWLLGENEKDIATLPEVHAVESDQTQVINALDKLRGYKLPLALNALRAYIDALPDFVLGVTPGEPNRLVNHSAIELALGACAAMISNGVPSPTAALFMGLGLESRAAAMACAKNFTGDDNSHQAVYEWVASLEDVILETWDCDGQALEVFRLFQERVRDGLDVFGAPSITGSFT